MYSYDKESETILNQEFPPNLLHLEITQKCNFKCKHCYFKNIKQATSSELPVIKFKKILKQAYRLGVTNIILTGGEPLLHPNFLEIYNYAYTLFGNRITINSNGSFVTKKILDTFKKKPPMLIRITLYGVDNITYRKITGKAAYTTVLNNLKSLKKFNLELRTLPLYQLKKYFKKLDNLSLNFTKKRIEFNPIIIGKNARKVSLSTHDLFDLFCNRYKINLKVLKHSAEVFNCSAGIRSFHIDSKGNMGLCFLLRKKRVKALPNLRIAFKTLKYIRQSYIKKFKKCASCKYRNICFWCPGFAEQEIKSFDPKSSNSAKIPRLCKLAKLFFNNCY